MAHLKKYRWRGWGSLFLCLCMWNTLRSPPSTTANFFVVHVSPRNEPIFRLRSSSDGGISQKTHISWKSRSALLLVF